MEFWLPEYRPEPEETATCAACPALIGEPCLAFGHPAGAVDLERDGAATPRLVELGEDRVQGVGVVEHHLRQIVDLLSGGRIVEPVSDGPEAHLGNSAHIEFQGGHPPVRRHTAQNMLTQSLHRGLLLVVKLHVPGVVVHDDYHVGQSPREFKLPAALHLARLSWPEGGGFSRCGFSDATSLAMCTAYELGKRGSSFPDQVKARAMKELLALVGTSFLFAGSFACFLFGPLLRPYPLPRLEIFISSSNLLRATSSEALMAFTVISEK